MPRYTGTRIRMTSRGEFEQKPFTITAKDPREAISKISRRYKGWRVKAARVRKVSE